jgi:uncharacterized protein YjbI with pentapeptide repeats
MKIKNGTPFAFGTKVTARKPRELEMTVIVRGSYTLAPGEPLAPIDDPLASLKGEEHRDGDDDRTGEAVYPGDFADFKLCGEVMLVGSCHVAGNKPLKECLVRLTVGAWSKTLRVVGRRVWSDGMVQSASSPLPFTEMPLDYAHAFGGPEYAKNPVGKGLGTAELPNVELATAPLRARGDRPEPASFGPVSSRWPQRASKIGREYGASYRKTRAPFYAEDFDWSHFNAAPPDQWLDGYLRGDEEVTLQNLHPASPLFSVRLPALRVRAFVRDDERRFREVYMALDTLLVAPDEGKLSLTWRGLTPVKADDLKDVEALLLASEPLAERPLPEAHYLAAMEAFEADPRGLEEHIQKNVPEHLQGAARSVLQGGDLGLAPPPGAPPVEALAKLVQSVSGLGAGDAAQMAKGLEQAAAKMAPHTDLGAAIGAALASKPAPGAPLVQGAMPKVPIADAMKKLAAQLDVVKKTAAARGGSVPGVAQLEALLADPRLRQIDPAVAKPGEPPPPPPPEPGPGVDCSGRDLRGMDLSGRDLRGADLRGAILGGVKLRKALLAGADLREASLVEADLEEADLEGADLSRANLTKANARRASFKGVTLDMAFVQKACLAGATLDGAGGKTVLWSGADLTGARARGVRFEKLICEGATIERIDLTEAQLVECHLVRCKAAGAVLADAFVPRTSFAWSDLTGAIFTRARGDRTIWLGARLARADLRGAVLPWALFNEATGPWATFASANLKGSRFYRASLEQADLTQANLLGANFCKAVLSGARFTGANLFEAQFLDSMGHRTDFSGANLKRAMFERS